ncbi:MAG: DnaJ domain-containing protein [Flavobacteriales bacterium]
MKNYYEILEVAPHASPDDIRKSFRRLVKLYHPDLNPNPDAKYRFMEVHEAYEFLCNHQRRQSYDRSRQQADFISEAEKARRQQVYRQWVAQQQELAAKRAAYYATRDFKTYQESNWYRIAKKVNVGVNIVFILISFGIIVVPLYKYAEQQNLPFDQQRPFFYFVFPIIAGLIFCLGGYYYWFIVKTDDY